MAELPSGTVTFVFTDIEGSTELLTSLGDAYRDVLERHNELLRSAFAKHGGVEVATEGDAFFVVFTRAPAAARAALDGQRALSSEPWPREQVVMVRMGLHTGDGLQGAGNYVGLDVHRAARIAAAAHGGQVLLSDASRALAQQALGAGVAFRDLGRHRLKGVPALEHIFQLVADDLPSQFPAIRTVDAQPNNLPAALTSFIGREAQVAEITQRLESARLLTLTGPGGTGKTRLSVRVAEEVISSYEHGCWFVALDALRDAELVPVTIADALGVKVPADQPAMTALESWLADRDLLLLLDNFEHVSAAAVHITRLLAAAPRLRVLVTSRTPLHVYGEQEYPVPPLGNAAQRLTASQATPEALSQYEAARLFIERAVAVKPDFRVTNANAPAVAEICDRLDGLPLAIELAAARVKLLAPEQILGRLEESLSLLASPARDVPQRQRTLRGAIDWSHDLLSEPDRRLFARLSIFRGSITLAAAEEVCHSEDLGTDVLDGISSLVDSSLLHALESPAETRFAMLGTIREYARERLWASTERDVLAQRHAGFFFALALAAGAELMGPEQSVWLNRLQLEHDNLRAALERAPGLGMLSDALNAAGTMWRFWQLSGHFADGRATLEGLLEQPGGDAAGRAMAMTGAGGLAYWQGDFEAMARHYTAARGMFEEQSNLPMLAQALYNESYVGMLRQDFAAARPLLERAIAIYRDLGDAVGATEAELTLAYTYYTEADLTQALTFMNNVIATYRAAGTRWMLAETLTSLAWIQAANGNWDDAAAALRESVALFDEMGNEVGLVLALEATAVTAAWVGDAERSARLLGKVEEIKSRHGGGAPSQMFAVGILRERAVTDLGTERFGQLQSEGRRLTSAQAAALALEFRPPPDSPPTPPLVSGGR